MESEALLGVFTSLHTVSWRVMHAILRGTQRLQIFLRIDETPLAAPSVGGACFYAVCVRERMMLSCFIRPCRCTRESSLAQQRRGVPWKQLSIFRVLTIVYTILAYRHRGFSSMTGVQKGQGRNAFGLWRMITRFVCPAATTQSLLPYKDAAFDPNQV